MQITAQKAKEEVPAPPPTGDCGMCNKSIAKCKPKGSICCGFCDVSFCLGCTDFTAYACNNFINRADVLWACYQCISRLDNAKLATPIDQPPPETQGSAEVLANGVSVLRKFEDLQGEINGLKCQVSEAVNGIKTFSNSIEKQMREVMNETIFGDEYPEFDPSISHKQAKRIAKEQNKPAPPTLNTVMHTAVVEQKKAEKQEDSEKAIARCNIIVYGLDEPKEADGEKRKEQTERKIEELFGFLEVEGIIPVKAHRIGKFKEDGDDAKPRPLKIILNNQAEAEIIVKNCKKLKNAPTGLKKLSVSHDLTNEERIHIKDLVKKAKDQTAKSSNLDFKVVGPPWQPTIKSFKKRGPE